MGDSASSLLRAIAVSLAVAAVTTVTIVLVAYLAAPVAGVRVEGARMFPESEAWDAVPEHASLLTFNTEMLEQRVNSNPWVQSAEVSKNWESGIVAVEVEERRAMLDGYVDGRRVILAADGTELPGLGGESLERVELDEDQLEDVREAGGTLRENGLTLASVDAVGPGGIEATVEGRRVIFSDGIGEGQARALRGVMARHPDAPLFDLRSPERVVVGGGAPDGGTPDGGLEG
jgi:hypothetical protein